MHALALLRTIMHKKVLQGATTPTLAQRDTEPRQAKEKEE